MLIRKIELLACLALFACKTSQGGSRLKDDDASDDPASDIDSPSDSDTAESAAASAVVGPVKNLSKNNNVKIGRPAFSAKVPEIAISRKQYFVSWNTNTRNLNYAAWRLNSGDLGGVDRKNDFSTDAELKLFLNQAQIKNDRGAAVTAVIDGDYTNTCFDRGHQVASADRTAVGEDNSTTFYMSNMIPQTSWLNRTVWAHLEAHERDLATAGETLYIFSGPIYAVQPVHFTGVNHNIAIPTGDFKVIVETVDGASPTHVTSVIMPNLTQDGSDPSTASGNKKACADYGAGSSHAPSADGMDDWRHYIVGLGEVEAAAGLSFKFLRDLGAFAEEPAG